MAFLEINPRYREMLDAEGLVSAEQFLALPGAVFCGHPDRNVARTRLGSDSDELEVFLKREHAVSWKTRVANAWAGFGFVSRSVREARLLHTLQRAGVTAPEWIAAGEDNAGRAFLLVRELEGMRDLRTYLESAAVTPVRRRLLARAVGAALAHMHEAGFEQPDLYSKHVLVGATLRQIGIVDWPRGWYGDFVSWPQRWRDLAALHATLAGHLASPRDRLACLRVYLRRAASPSLPRHIRVTAVRTILRHARHLERHRHIRELRETTGHVRSSVVWQDGEALCLTPEGQAFWRSQSADWLTAHGLPVPEKKSAAGMGGSLEAVPASASKPFSPHRNDHRLTIVPAAAGELVLSRRRTEWPIAWVWSWLLGKSPTAPEVRQAGLIFRLQRYRIETPRLLAFGQRHCSPWWTQSFLLTERPPGAVPWADWLGAQAHGGNSLTDRRHVLRQAGALLRRMHNAGCRLAPAPAHGPTCPLAVRLGSDGRPAVLLEAITGVVAQGKRDRGAVANDLALIIEPIKRRTDRLRVVLGYLGRRPLHALDRRLKRVILAPTVRGKVRSVGPAMRLGAAAGDALAALRRGQ